ncbi:TIR-NBS-LRR resistance protein [Trifolium medium]|uniref:TIR-NBS-LRR resistance protein n=1 Tax=Trifolium medium TaxID=97028 RepID=A0A392MIR5_9FABA|nr:TIR-NBS-LRR resistance protein [Trifolium medium]
MERCEGEKKKVENEAKNMITEIKELMSSIKNSKSSYAASLSKQQKLKDKWEGFRIAFAERETVTLIKWPRLIYLSLASLGGIAFLALFGYGMISITID